MTVVKVLELVGESSKSWQDAANQAVVEAARTVDNITGVEVSNWTAHVENGQISNYKANVRVAFIVDGGRRKTV
ncbi:MAG: dodecin domain-containing protein [Bacillota bacterium]|nr:MAG: dodecin domain-containing protein [Bacillota bacterium]